MSRMILGENSPLSDHVTEWAEERREQARGYRDMRNILFGGGLLTTALLNLTESVSSMGTVDQIKFNAGGVALSALAGLGMEIGRRRWVNAANAFDSNAKDLKELGL